MGKKVCLRFRRRCRVYVALGYRPGLFHKNRLMAFSPPTMTRKNIYMRLGLGCPVPNSNCPQSGLTYVRRQWQRPVDLPDGYDWYGQRLPAPSPAPEPVATDPVGFLEVPGPDSFQSGIGYIRGWVCDGREVEIYIDDGLRLPATARGLDRADTEEACGDRDNGFISLHQCRC